MQAGAEPDALACSTAGSTAGLLRSSLQMLHPAITQHVPCPAMQACVQQGEASCQQHAEGYCAQAFAGPVLQRR